MSNTEVSKVLPPYRNTIHREGDTLVKVSLRPQLWTPMSDLIMVSVDKGCIKVYFSSNLNLPCVRGYIYGFFTEG